MDEEWAHITGCWQAWLTESAAKRDADEVKRRLAQVPESMREQVRSHARLVWHLSATNETGGRKQHHRSRGQGDE